MLKKVARQFHKSIFRSQFLLFNVAIDQGMLTGQQDYTKFIILGRARTGSNFLRGLLNSHKQITVFGEIFRDADAIDWSLPTYSSDSKHLISLIQKDPVQLLSSKVFRPYPKHIAAVGFKLFYYQAHSDSWQSVWSYLQDPKEKFNIIHLKRRNILKTYLSEEKAFQTGKWVDTTGSSRKEICLYLDYDKCLEKFEITRQQEKKYDDFFADNPKINIVYEDLARDPVAQMKRIQEFLGVEYQESRPSTYKQASQPLSEAIANYDSLKEQFQGSRWETFFEV